MYLSSAFFYSQFLGDKRVLSKFRRYTYYVSREQPYRTFSERVGDGDFSSLDSIKDAFSVERVTRDFYTEYDRIFKHVEALITGFGNSREETEKKRLFTQKLFNRLMFIAFIQKKRWLKYGAQTDYLSALWQAYKNEASSNSNIYRDRLKILFFSGLNTQNDVNIVDINRKGFLGKVIGDVPYLNGGLFEEDEDDRNTNIKVPDECLDKIINDLFNRFNFTVTENTPLDIEVAVDPEMLGKVFEELVTGRHETGSYYTPKSVVSFMCREALKGYLGGYEKLVDEHDNNTISISQARELIGKLKRITVCDPACGSGAYLVGMLHELQYLHRLLDTRVSETTARDDYQLKLEIIQNNLYGVDVDSFAVNIAQLRLWLSLAVEYEGDKPEPLPNLDFKIEVGNSLTSPDPQTGIRPGFRAEFIKRFKEKKDEYVGTHEPGPKHTLRDEIKQLRQQIAEWTHSQQRALDFDWAVDFVEVFSSGGFDIAIANPPYGIKCEDPLRFQYFPRTKDEEAQSKDSYGLFMARALQLLKTGGFFSFIVSDTWRTIRSHRPLRSRLLSETTVQHVIDLPSWIFEATVNSCILSLRKQIPQEEHTLIAVDLRNLPSDDWNALEANLLATARQIPDVQTITYARYTYPQNLISTYENMSFFIGSPRMYRLMNEKRFTKIGSIADVKVGLQTGDNEYYLRKQVGSRGSYQELNKSLLLKDSEIDNLSNEEKINGVDPSRYGGRCFVPYDKGGESNSDGGWLPNYYVPTDYYIDWSQASLHRLKTKTSDKAGGNIASRFQNSDYYFKQRISFSDTGYYAPTFRLGGRGIFDVMGMSVFVDNMNTNYALSILTSKLTRYLIKNYINHSVHTQVEGLKQIPILREDSDKATILIALVDSIIIKQKQEPYYPYHLNEQKEIDTLICSIYGLNDEDIREIELWYCRRYPKLAEAQGVLSEVKQKHSEHLKRCELVMTKGPDYWNSNPVLVLIAQGEGEKLEFKETLDADSKTGEKNTGVLLSSLKTIAAFLNTRGGTLIMGVSDSGEIIGLEKDYKLCNKHNKDGLEQKIRSLLASRFVPQPTGKIKVSFEYLEDKQVCVVNVEQSKDIIHLDGKDVYVREGNTSHKLEGPTLTAWARARN